MNEMHDHEEYVTNRVRQWFDEHHSDVIGKWLAEISRENADAGNEPETTDYTDYEDADYLSGEMREFAVRELVLPTHPFIVRALLSDSLSEANWLELAAHYLDGGELSMPLSDLFLPTAIVGTGRKRAIFHVRSKKQGMAFLTVVAYAGTIKEATKLAGQWASIPGNVNFPYYLDRFYE